MMRTSMFRAAMVAALCGTAACTSDEALFWLLLALLGPIAVGIGLLVLVLRGIGGALEKISEALAGVVRPPPLADPQGLTIPQTRLSIERTEVFVGEPDFLSWSFSMSNPRNLDVTILSEVFAEAQRVAFQEETTSASARGFAVGGTASWAQPGIKQIRGRTTVMHGGQPIATAELTGTVWVKSDR